MAVVTVAFEDLNTWLQNQPTNTADTPYELNITGLTASNIGSSLTTGTLGNVIKTNSTKYVDLEATTLPVVNSLQYCFQLCGKLVKSPVIPNGVTNMENCFFGCTSLTAAPVIPDSVTNMSYCFSQCITLTTAPNVPNNVTNILRCFQGCKSLTTAPNIPNGVTSLEACFNGCTSLTIAPNIPNGVTNLRVCFTDCTSLTTAPNIPNSVTNMEGCFANCTSLTTWEQSNTLDNITNYLIAFDRCTSLVNINTDRPYELKQWLTQIHSASTDNFPNDPANCVYSSYSEVVEVSFSDLNNELSTWSANTAQTPYKLNVTELTANDIVSSETSGSLGYVLRQNNTKYVDLSNTTIPQVTDMESCFESCTSLVGALNIPDTVTNIDYCFNGCTAITKWEQIDLLDNITSYNNAFKSCSNLTNIYADAPYEVNQFLNTLYTASADNFPNDPESLNYSLCSTPAEIPFSRLNNELSFLPENAANTAYVIKVTELTVSDIGRSSTAGTLGNIIKTNSTKYVDLSETTLPNSVTIMAHCFNGCTSLTAAPIIPSSVTNMGSCFRDCTSLRTAPIIPNDVTEMSYCFRGCTSLTTAPIIPNNVTAMGGCFYGCTSLTEAPVIPSRVIMFGECFEGCTSLRTAPIIPDNITGMSYCFRGCTSLTEAPVIPNNVTAMDHCFNDCTSLTTAPIIPNNVTYARDCFRGCTSLRTAPNVPSSVTDMRFFFYGCTSLEEITLFEADLDSLVANNMAKDCFSGCTSLTKIGVPPSDPPAESDWHVYRLKFGASTVEGKVYDKTGTVVTIPQTSITKSTLELPIKTDELWFPSGYTDAQIDEIIQKVIQYRYTYRNGTDVLDPAEKNFVLWADDPDNVKTNLNMGGGTAEAVSIGSFISNLNDFIEEDVTYAKCDTDHTSNMPSGEQCGTVSVHSTGSYVTSGTNYATYEQIFKGGTGTIYQRQARFRPFYPVSWDAWKKVLKNGDSIEASDVFINGYQQKRYYEIDASSLSTSYFYPVTFDTSDLELDCEIHSPSRGGADPYNQNYIHFLLISQGWSDTRRRLDILHYGVYDASEITIGCIGAGEKYGVNCVWVRGGITYRFYCNRTPTLRTSDYSSPNETFTVGTNYYGGSNTSVQIQWTPNGQSSARFDGTLYANVQGDVTGNCSGSSSSCSGNAATATMPLGFSSRGTSGGWGNTVGTTITTYNDSTGGSVDFRRDNPSAGKMSIKVDGRFYFNEGNTPAAGLKFANDYYGLTGADGEDSVWIRSTTQGFIPYQSGGAKNGHNYLGTSSWYWKYAYIDQVFCPEKLTIPVGGSHSTDGEIWIS